MKDVWSVFLKIISRSLKKSIFISPHFMNFQGKLFNFQFFFLGGIKTTTHYFSIVNIIFYYFILFSDVNEKKNIEILFRMVQRERKLRKKNINFWWKIWEYTSISKSKGFFNSRLPHFKYHYFLSLRVLWRTYDPFFSKKSLVV
jgi:hypothetical protein